MEKKRSGSRKPGFVNISLCPDERYYSQSLLLPSDAHRKAARVLLKIKERQVLYQVMERWITSSFQISTTVSSGMKQEYTTDSSI